jgi:rSAM/selenodomain-associated transferase 2
MRGFTAMRRASQGQFLVAQTETLGCALFDQRQRLQCLHCGTRKYGRADVAKSQSGFAVGIANGNGAAVAAFDQRPACDFDQNRVTHSVCFTCSTRLPDCGFAGNVRGMHSATGRLSIIIPALEEAAIIVATLQALTALRARGAEVIVVDGGSSDGTVALARPLADHVIVGQRNRGAAMNAGAALGHGDVFVFLHADTTLPDNADRLIATALSGRATDCAWGRFDLRIAGRHPLLALVARMINWRSRLTGVATGDQAIFVTREAFSSVHGFADLPLMEDIALSRKLKRRCRPICIAAPAVTSGRRWDHHGVWHTIALMWRLRLGYYFGVAPARLALAYGRIPRSPAQSGA